MKKHRRYLNQWIKLITKDETDLSIKRHIVRHAKEIYQKESQSWSDSMRNLVEIYERKCRVKPSLLRQIKKLENKYKKNPKRYTSPPKHL